MAAEILPFPRQLPLPMQLPVHLPVPTTPGQDDPEVLALAVEVLERVQRGDTVAIAFIEVNRDNRPVTSYRFAAGTEYATLAGAALLHQELLDLARADEDDAGGETA